MVHPNIYQYSLSSLETPRLSCLLSKTSSSSVTREQEGKGSRLCPVHFWGAEGEQIIEDGDLPVISC